MPSFDAQERDNRELSFDLKSGEAVFSGEIGCIDATGEVVAAKTATNLTALGRIENVGEEQIIIRKGCFRYNNSSTDALSKADVGKDCYISDSTTVCKTATGKSKAGKVALVEDGGVWVEFR